MRASTADLRNANLLAVYKYIYEHKEATKTEISYALRLSLPTVTQDLNELLSSSRILSAQKAEASVGRPAMLYQFNSNHHVSFGVEVLQKKVYVATVDLYGKIIKEAKLERKFENTPEYFQEIGDFINGFIDPQGYPDGDILGVTFAVQGIVSEDNEHMTFGTLLNTTDFTRENFAKHFRHKVSLVHDTEAAAIAEDWYVHGSDLNAIYLSLNHNLGSARIIGGKVVHTDNLSSGTIEHMTLYPRGKVCYCGKKGCVDRYVSAEALMEAAGMTIPEFFAAKKAGDKKVLKIWNQYLNDLALVIENARMVIDGCVILGGLLDEYITDDDIDKLKKCIRSISCFPQVEPVIIHSHYGSKATLIGSAITEISVYLQRIGLDL